MVKTALAAALIAGTASSAAYAKATQFLLETSSGGVYCDGLLLTIKGKVAVGTHNSPQNNCGGPEGDYAGGFEAMGYRSGVDYRNFHVTKTTEVFSITTEDIKNLASGIYLVFNLDIKRKTWELGLGGDGNNFGLINAGVLGIGGDPRVHRPLGRPSFEK